MCKHNNPKSLVFLASFNFDHLIWPFYFCSIFKGLLALFPSIVALGVIIGTPSLNTLLQKLRPLAVWKMWFEKSSLTPVSKDLTDGPAGSFCSAASQTPVAEKSPGSGPPDWRGPVAAVYVRDFLDVLPQNGSQNCLDAFFLFLDNIIIDPVVWSL